MAQREKDSIQSVLTSILLSFWLTKLLGLNGISKIFLLIYSPLKTVLSWSIPRDTRLSSILNSKVSPGSETRKKKRKTTFKSLDWVTRLWLTHSKYLLRKNGYSVLLENLHEQIDATLNPIIARNTFKRVKNRILNEVQWERSRLAQKLQTLHAHEVGEPALPSWNSSWGYACQLQSHRRRSRRSTSKLGGW